MVESSFFIPWFQMFMSSISYQAIQWIGGIDGHLRLIDQTQLPGKLVYLDCHDVEMVREAIISLRVRGAPAIGIAAAYGVVVGMKIPDCEFKGQTDTRFDKLLEFLRSSRPTAVNLFWALERMKNTFEREKKSLDPVRLRERFLDEAKQLHQQDAEMCRAIGKHGAKLLTSATSVLTHCNAGGLATAGYGTALSAIFTCQDQGHGLHVYVDETRPLLQGARLTTWELMGRGIDCTLICDSMAAQVMREGKIQAVITGADRIAANGDTANKIGTYGLAVLAKAHNVPFYIAAPSSTFDLTIDSGIQIPIEQRASEEITEIYGQRMAPANVRTYNPAFDVTPAEWITAIITEKGVISPVNRLMIERCISSG
jgi:methylthioribose-1-phosphate isomerase